MTRERLRRALGLAAPVMLAYVSIGIPCGVMEAEVGFTPLLAFLFSATYYSGAGQFMVANLCMAGVPLLSVWLSVSLVTTRQLLYSTAFSRYLGGEEQGRALGFAALVTDETFGLNFERYASGEGWGWADAMVVNVASMLSWACANGLGVALGQVLELPVDVMSFGMTAIFICLLVGQTWERPTVVAVVAASAAVAACKLAGLGSLAIFIGAVVGVACGTVLGGEGEP